MRLPTRSMSEFAVLPQVSTYGALVCGDRAPAPIAEPHRRGRRDGLDCPGVAHTLPLARRCARDNQNSKPAIPLAPAPPPRSELQRLPSEPSERVVAKNVTTSLCSSEARLRAHPRMLKKCRLPTRRPRLKRCRSGRRVRQDGA